jgi:hypothetical protein
VLVIAPQNQKSHGGYLTVKCCFFQETTQKCQADAAGVVSTDKFGNVVIRIQAKPGAKQNAITGITLYSFVSVHNPETIILF